MTDTLPQTEIIPSPIVELMEPSELVKKTQRDMLKVFKSSGIKLHMVASWAVKKRKHDILKLLIEQNVDIEHPNNSGFTPLGLAVLAGDKKTVEMLCESGASVDLMDGNGITPLKYANLTHHRAIGQVLRSYRNSKVGDMDEGEVEPSLA